MFFEGSLQEGIATALQQSKLVVCFVTGNYHFIPRIDVFAVSNIFPDGESESQKWETEFLVDDAVRLSDIDTTCDHHVDIIIAERAAINSSRHAQTPGRLN
jgi:hypothetical protein